MSYLIMEGKANLLRWKKIRDFIPEFMPLKSAAMF